MTTLAGVLKELSQSHDDERLSQLAERALQLLEELPALDCSQREQRSTATQLHTAGIGLWNRSVALKSAGAITLNLNAQSESVLNYLPHSQTTVASYPVGLGTRLRPL